MAEHPYNDAAYKTAKRHLLAVPTPCWRCGARATSPDHDPPLTRHTHVRGSGCCVLRPSCLPCQRSQGAGITNQRRSTGYDWPA